MDEDPAADAPEGADAQQVPLLHGLEHYLRSRGVHVPRPNDNAAANAWMDDAAAVERQREGSEHQESVHRSVFADQDEKESNEKEERELFLWSLRGRTIAVTSGGGEDGETTKTFTSVPLDALASTCDTVYTLIRSRPLFSRQNSAVDPTEANELVSSTALTLDLVQFPSPAVESFLLVAAHYRPPDPLPVHDKDNIELLACKNLPDDHVVDVCRIAHFVQCRSIFDETVEILKDAIDSDNCLSICHLADSLGVPSLFEASTSYLIGTLKGMEEHEHWEEFPTSLRHRIITMRNAVHSSILGRGQKTTIFFSSSEEFLAIFSDNIHEQRERLAEAKRRQDEVIRERIKRGGSHRDPYGGDVAYAAGKIERQEARIKTLEAFYREQKSIFAGGSADAKKPFQLGYT